jgi:hypothetical protein
MNNRLALEHLSARDMLALWQKELGRLEKEQEEQGITLWSINFAKAKIELWQARVRWEDEMPPPQDRSSEVQEESRAV